MFTLDLGRDTLYTNKEREVIPFRKNVRAFMYIYIHITCMYVCDVRALLYVYIVCIYVICVYVCMHA